MLRKNFSEVLQCPKQKKKIFKLNILGSTGKRKKKKKKFGDLPVGGIK